jgi:hypothetical protein
VVDNLRAAVNNMINGINNCGYAENVWTASAAYQGDTSRYANIDESNHCSSNWPDGQSTLSWLTFDDHSILASTCINKVDVFGTKFFNEVDTAISKGTGLVTTFPQPCNNSYYDLQTVMTHEWGHGYGLAHESSGPDEVMYPYVSPCALRRHLGKGDYNGMASLYG